eukprot:gb/GECG01010135.1/.p1 GENE.gb/GECG01010135.1/~~gb/GECG01010135.1/.p1  ORF type:complete len:242 (+),score=35.06 gb/GECG01010135.1/:1-726(+)
MAQEKPTASLLGVNPVNGTRATVSNSNEETIPSTVVERAPVLSRGAYPRTITPPASDATTEYLPGTPVQRTPLTEEKTSAKSRYAAKTVMRLFNAAKSRNFGAIRSMATSSDCLLTTDAAGNTLLHKLLKGDSLEDHSVARAILEDEDISIDPNIQDGNGKTLLHLAVENGSIEIADTLFAIGADPNIVDRERKTVLKHLVETRQFNLCQYFFRQYDTLFDMSVPSNAEASVEERKSRPVH